MIEILGFNFNLSQFFTLSYFLVINFSTFFIFAWDKFKSRGEGRRVSEKKLWFLAFIGGSIGALLSMHLFRHKTTKLSFQTVLALIVLLQITLVTYIVLKF